MNNQGEFSLTELLAILKQNHREAHQKCASHILPMCGIEPRSLLWWANTNHSATPAPLDEWKDGWINGCMDGWTGIWMNSLPGLTDSWQGRRLVSRPCLKPAWWLFTSNATTSLQRKSFQKSIDCPPTILHKQFKEALISSSWLKPVHCLHYQQT